MTKSIGKIQRVDEFGVPFGPITDVNVTNLNTNPKSNISDLNDSLQVVTNCFSELHLSVNLTGKRFKQLYQILFDVEITKERTHAINRTTSKKFRAGTRRTKKLARNRR